MTVANFGVRGADGFLMRCTVIGRVTEEDILIDKVLGPDGVTELFLDDLGWYDAEHALAERHVRDMDDSERIIGECE